MRCSRGNIEAGAVTKAVTAGAARRYRGGEAGAAALVLRLAMILALSECREEIGERSLSDSLTEISWLGGGFDFFSGRR